MAMTAEGLGNAIYEEMKSVYWPDTPLPQEAEAETKKYYTTIASGFIKYFIANYGENDT